MKKFLKLFVITVLAIFVVGTAKALEKPEVTDHEKINVYIFRGSGCSHCYEALSFLYGLNGEYDDYMNVVSYEIWENQNNASLAKDVAKKLGEELQGVPYIVVGNRSFAGFGESTGTEILETVIKGYKSKKYKDTVASVIKAGNYDVTSQTLQEAAYAEGITEVAPTKVEEEKDDTVVVFVIFAAVIAGVAALVFSSRKK